MPAGFFQGWAMRGSEGWKSLSGVQEQSINTLSTESFDICSTQKKTSQHFQGGVEASSPLPLPAGAHDDDLWITSQELRDDLHHVYWITSLYGLA